MCLTKSNRANAPLKTRRLSGNAPGSRLNLYVPPMNLVIAVLKSPINHFSSLPSCNLQALNLRGTNVCGRRCKAAIFLSLPPSLPTYLPTYLPSYLPSYLPTYLPIYLPTYLPTFLPIYRPTYSTHVASGLHYTKRSFFLLID